jgi:hypothetical protein
MSILQGLQPSVFFRYFKELSRGKSMPIQPPQEVFDAESGYFIVEDAA